MELILEGRSEHIAHARRKIGLFGEEQKWWLLWSNKMYYTDQTTMIAPISELPSNLSAIWNVLFTVSKLLKCILYFVLGIY